jgi:hypothetical protein
LHPLNLLLEPPCTTSSIILAEKTYAALLKMEAVPAT